VLLPSDTHRKPISAILLQLVAYLLTLPRISSKMNTTIPTEHNLHCYLFVPYSAPVRCCYQPGLLQQAYITTECQTLAFYELQSTLNKLDAGSEFLPLILLYLLIFFLPYFEILLWIQFSDIIGNIPPPTLKQNYIRVLFLCVV
jgi:hypothetical protein